MPAVTATQIADACELAIRTGSTSGMRALLHPRVQGTSADRVTYTGVDDVLAWGQAAVADPTTTITVVERYIDEPVAVLVLMCGRGDDSPGVEYTVALIARDDALVRIVVDA